MKFKHYVKTTCKESSIHGLPYLAKQELHWLERAFWGLIIIVAVYFSVSICLNQWERFRDNPIVYGLELTKYKLDYPFPGVTMCTLQQNIERAQTLAHKLWGHQNEHSDYYLQFLGVVNVLRSDTLNNLKTYANDTTLKKLDFLDMLQHMRYKDMELEKGIEMAASISEAGFCQTTSQLSQYTNPFGTLEHLDVCDTVHCNIFNVCTKSILPSTMGPSTDLRIYLHNVYDVVAINDERTIVHEIAAGDSVTIEVEQTWISAEDSVRNLPIEYRKCRYSDENDLIYYKVYTVSLCKLECRINAALQLCNCKPYFYATAPQAPSCNIDGLICLAAKNWSNTTCKCLPLCDEIKYHILERKVQKVLVNPQQFQSTAIITIITPDMAMRRRVVFSTDQLLVSFGGAVSLFLGMSFVSIFGFVYVLLVYIITNVKACFKCRRYH